MGLAGRDPGRSAFASLGRRTSRAADDGPLRPRQLEAARSARGLTLGPAARRLTLRRRPRVWPWRASSAAIRARSASRSARAEARCASSTRKSGGRPRPRGPPPSAGGGASFAKAGVPRSGSAKAADQARSAPRLGLDERWPRRRARSRDRDRVCLGLRDRRLARCDLVRRTNAFRPGYDGLGRQGDRLDPERSARPGSRARRAGSAGRPGTTFRDSPRV